MDINQNECDERQPMNGGGEEGKKKTKRQWNVFSFQIILSAIAIAGEKSSFWIYSLTIRYQAHCILNILRALTHSVNRMWFSFGQHVLDFGYRKTPNRRSVLSDVHTDITGITNQKSLEKRSSLWVWKSVCECVCVMNDNLTELNILFL